VENYDSWFANHILFLKDLSSAKVAEKIKST
jgi:hypothetical protein